MLERPKIQRRESIKIYVGKVPVGEMHQFLCSQ